MKPGLKKALKIAAMSVGGLFVLVTGVGLCLPTTLRVQRSVVVAGTPQDIYPFIANFRNGWTQWSPFEGEDAQLRMSYSGPEQGVGAARKWDSENMGDGHMEITQADPAHGVAFDLTLMHDSYQLKGSLVCEPAEGGTKVTWTDDVAYGPNPYRRYMGVVVKKPLSDAFDKGLAALKAKVEARAVATPSR